MGGTGCGTDKANNECRFENTVAYRTASVKGTVETKISVDN